MFKGVNSYWAIKKCNLKVFGCWPCEKQLAISELPACIVLHSILLSKHVASSSLPSSHMHNKKRQLLYALHSTFVGSFA
jgi:hypothetical protein